MCPYPARWILALLVGLGGLRAANEQPVTVIAVQVRGTVEVQHGASTVTALVTEGAQLGAADTITTAAQSSVLLVIPNGSVIALKEKSRLKIAMALQSPMVGAALAASGTEPREPGVSQTTFELAFGEMLTRVRKLNPASTFTVQTPVSVAAVRGTVFEVSFQLGATGAAQYCLCTSSGLVHVTPHMGKTIAVPGNAQVEFAAEIGKNGIKIKNLKSSKPALQKRQQLEKEAVANEHSAGELMQRVQATGTGAQAKGAAQTTGPSVTDRAKTGIAPAGTPESGTDRTASPTTPTSKTVAPPTNPAPGAAKPTDSTARPPATPAVKPTTPPAKPKIPPRVKTPKRPPRRPGN